LLEVAHVQPGYLSRSRVRALRSGTHRLLQARDVSPEGGVQVDAAIRFRPERNPDLYRVSRGDILVVARGQDHRACLVTVDLVDTLASSVFYIIRPQEQVVLPGFLAWWLNRPRVQAEIRSQSRGTGIGYISRQTIEHLPVVLPSLRVQRGISEAVSLWQKKQVLQASLDEKREQLIHAICRQAVRQDKE